MDTTQKTREEAAQSRPRKEAPKSVQKRPQDAKKKRPEDGNVQRRPVKQGTAQPAGAKQRSGAAQTQQRGGTAAKPKPQRPKQAAPKQTTAKQKRPARKPDPNDVPNKKRAYGNSKPKKKSTIAVMGDSIARTVERAKAKQTSKGKKKQRPQQPVPAVIYTRPQAFNRNRLLVQLATVVAIVAALVMGLSVFFKVENITVTGADVYTAWTVVEASGIEEGDNLLTFSHARAGALIKANLPYVDKVRFGIKLPDTVNIIIEEEDVVYAIKDNTGLWWLMNSDGRIVEQTSSGRASNYTQVLGVTLETPIANEKAVATEIAPVETVQSGEYIPVTVTGAQRLNAAMDILQALEENDIVGDAASVDVSRIEDIILWYGTRYQVNLGDSTRLDYKIACMNDVILQMSDYQSGILDISFTIWPDQVGYTPFS